MGKRKFKEEAVVDDDDGESAPPPAREPCLKRVKRDHSDDNAPADNGHHHASAELSRRLKRVKHERLDDNDCVGHHGSAVLADADRDLMPPPSNNGGGHHHQRRHSLTASCSAATTTAGLNGTLLPLTNGIGGDDGRQQQSVWLVRKPINMSMEELHQIHFSHKTKHRSQRFSSTTTPLVATARGKREMEEEETMTSTISNGDDDDAATAAVATSAATVECRLWKPIRPMVHVISDRKRTFDEKVPMTVGSCLRGVVWINRIEQLQHERRTNDANNGGGQRHEGHVNNNEVEQLFDDDGIDFIGTAGPSSPSASSLLPPIQIGSIRRRPAPVDQQPLRERLRAFGTMPPSMVATNEDEVAVKKNRDDDKVAKEMRRRRRK